MLLPLQQRTKIICSVIQNVRNVILPDIKNRTPIEKMSSVTCGIKIIKKL